MLQPGTAQERARTDRLQGRFEGQLTQIGTLGKRVGYSKKYYAHDENNAANVGDVVTIMATRPLSKMVRFRLVSIDQKVVTAENAAEAETKLEEAEGSSEVVAPAEEAK